MEGEALAAAVLRAAGRPTQGLAGRREDVGMSGELVFLIDAPQPAVVKVGALDRRVSAVELAREIEVLGWLDGRMGAPRLLWAGEVDGHGAVLMERLEGKALHAVAPDEAEAGAIVAIQALAKLHQLPVGSCPFDERLERKMGEAWRRVQDQEVDEGEFDADKAGRSAEAVWREMVRRRPLGEDLVVAHGDASWPNFIVGPEGVGLIDLGRLGVADRYQDLALFVRSGQRNAAHLDLPTLVERHYPIAALDQEKLWFYRTLDEFF